MPDHTGPPDPAPHVDTFGLPVGRPVDLALPIDAPSHETMVGRACSLVPLDSSGHAADLFDAYAAAPDGRGWTYMSAGPFTDRDALSAWLASVDSWPSARAFTIVDSLGPCGIAAYLRIAPDAPSVEVGNIHFAPRLQRTIAATEAMYLMMRRAFDAGYRRYEWKCDSLNSPSRAAAARLGFTYEGDFRNAMVYKQRSRDTSWFSITHDEWPARRVEFERWLDPANFDSEGRQRTALAHRH